ncbi:NAD(P)-dependent alcohol dehydrogenase [Gordonia rhizosphera]|uniref:Aryl-alcohol dehydrogenase AdhB n=1 Tax=Gordonia rhizosphera NBRC 16068 TaxID=1108045 RepID=K6W8I0_9ACTN|nr:NAD(P)-dependent alcohol dehydrogenase [Gordonia rhizosphera]GAB90056.1 aryl-alcohol dehydrogenase AdhB [Gordonia rhizosphera NBRC 16068]
MRIEAAVVSTPGGPFEVVPVDIDTPRDGEVLVRIRAVGICHTDLGMKATWSPRRCPQVFGHEGAGVVDAVGPGVTRVSPGQTVSLTFRSCDRCAQCRSGHPAYCTSGLNTAGRPDGSPTLTRAGAPVHGGFFGQSSFATYAIAHEDNTIPVPDTLPPVIAAPLGCGVQTGYGTVTRVLRPQPGATLTVYGAGSVGLCAVMAAVRAGAQVVAVDPIARRRDLAEKFGAVATVDPIATDDLAREVVARHGRGTDHAIDTTARQDVVNAAVAAAETRGDIALVGIGRKLEFDVMSVLYKGLSIRGVIEGDVDPHDMISELAGMYEAGHLPLDDLITTYPFAEIERAAQDSLAGTAIKPVLLVGA